MEVEVVLEGYETVIISGAVREVIEKVDNILVEWRERYGKEKG